MNGFLIPAGVEIGLISWRTVRSNQRPPLPSELAAVFIIFGGLGLLATAQPKIAHVLGWGVVVATAINLFPLPGVPSPLSQSVDAGLTIGKGGTGKGTVNSGPDNPNNSR